MYSISIRKFCQIHNRHATVGVTNYNQARTFFSGEESEIEGAKVAYLTALNLYIIRKD